MFRRLLESDQPAHEAFDDDGSGYVTYQEVNEFVDGIPEGLNWTCVQPSQRRICSVLTRTQTAALGCILGCR